MSASPLDIMKPFRVPAPGSDYHHNLIVFITLPGSALTSPHLTSPHLTSTLFFTFNLQELKIAENANKAGRYCQEDQNSIRYEEDLDQPQVVSLVDSYNVLAVREGRL